MSEVNFFLACFLLLMRLPVLHDVVDGIVVW